MSYIALYREWRPKVFGDIIGQEHITRTLENQIEQGRVAHAYLFCGTRGTGKTTTAKVFAKAVNCIRREGVEPCGKCEICTGIDSGNMMDVIEIDAASNNGVDNIRDLRDDVKFPPSICKYKVYIIDEVHMLSTQAFNALLKTLEEPPAHVIFILATTEFQKVPATIVSRCQRFDFKRIKSSDIVKRLKHIAEQDNINVDDRTLSLIARSSDGAMRDALSIFDQCISSGGGNVSYDDALSMLGITTDEYLIKIADAVAKEDTPECISLIDELVVNGKDVFQFIKDLTMHFRNLLIASVNDNAADILNVSDEMFEEFKIQSKKFSTEAILRNINILSEAESKSKWVSQPRIVLEMAIIKMCKAELSTDPDSILERISRLEKMVSTSAVPASEVQGFKIPAPKVQGSGAPAPGAQISEVAASKTQVPEEKFQSKNSTDSQKQKAKQETPASDAKDAQSSTALAAFGISLQEVSRKWKDILKAINEGGNKPLYAFLIEGKPVAMKNGVLTIGFEKGYAFHKGMVEEEKNRKIAESYVSSVCGSDLKIKCCMMDEIAADKQGDNFIEQTINIFGKDYVKVEE